MLRKEIQKLVELGRFPSEEDASDGILRKIEEAYRTIERPIRDEEAEALLALFGDDNCYGLAFSMMHLIETAPGWPISRCLDNAHNPWILELKARASRGGRL